MTTIKGKVVINKELGEGLHYVAFEGINEVNMETPHFVTSWGVVLKTEEAKEFEVGREVICKISLEE